MCAVFDLASGLCASVFQSADLTIQGLSSFIFRTICNRLPVLNIFLGKCPWYIIMLAQVGGGLYISVGVTWYFLNVVISFIEGRLV